MYNMISNFYPADEPKKGYIGKATLTIANAIKINDISVFEDENKKINLAFRGYDNDHSYVTPLSKEAYAAMVGVVEMAVHDNDKHFGHVTGKYNPFITAVGALVNEPYADGRFSLKLDDFCMLNGITTNVVTYEKGKFTAVNLPSLDPYENKEGKTIYPTVFAGLKSEYKDKDDKDQSKDFGSLIRKVVLKQRSALRERKPSLDEQVQGAKETADKENAGHTERPQPSREPERG